VEIHRALRQWGFIDDHSLLDVICQSICPVACSVGQAGERSQKCDAGDIAVREAVGRARRVGWIGAAHEGMLGRGKVCSSVLLGRKCCGACPSMVARTQAWRYMMATAEHEMWQGQAQMTLCQQSVWSPCGLADEDTATMVFSRWTKFCS
jgi:hypothetical protein